MITNYYETFIKMLLRDKVYTSHIAGHILYQHFSITRWYLTHFFSRSHKLI